MEHSAVFQRDAAAAVTESGRNPLAIMRAATTLCNVKRPSGMARLQAATTHFIQMQNERHNAAKDDIRRGWNDKIAEFN
jgi:hypothetical protein